MSRSATVKHDVITTLTTFGDLLRYLGAYGGFISLEQPYVNAPN